MNSYQLASIALVWLEKQNEAEQGKLKKTTTTATKQFMQRRQCNACTVT